MRMQGWRSLGHGLAAAALAFTVAACDDDTGTTDMGMDMSVQQMDMTSMTPPDMTGASPGTGRAILAEVKGNIIDPMSDGGVVAVPGAQMLTAITTFPKDTVAGDYVSPGFDPTKIVTNALYGCFGDRYDLQTSDAPTPDEDVGLVTFTGFNTPLSSNGGAPATPPDSIVCGHGGATAPFYGCVFAPTDAGTGFMGTSLSQVFTTGQAGDFITAGMTDITVNVAGGGSYVAQTTTIQDAPAAAKILGVKVGNGTAVTDLDDVGPISGTDDITITWACDPNGTMPGEGCPAAAFGDVMLVSLQTSQHPRQSFSRPPVTTKFGVMTCVSSTNRTVTVNGAGAGTIIVPKEAVATLLGTNPADNKSYLLSVVRVTTPIGKTNGSHLMFYGAGKGFFGMNDQ